MKKELPILVNYKKKHERFSQLCHEHHINGLLYYHYAEFRKESALKNHWLQQWHRNEVLEDQLKNLSTLLEKENIKPTLLKGLSLLGTIYQDYGSRFMSDIDLLCSKQEKEKIESSLIELGYQLLQTERWSANSHKSEWNKQQNGIEITIELHTKLYYHVELNTKTETIGSHLPGYTRLGLEDELIFLCTHYAFQHTYLKNFWLYDIYFFIQKYHQDIDWKVIEKKSKYYQVKKATFSCLYLVEREFDIQTLKHRNNLLELLLTKNFLWSNNRRNLHYLIIKHLVKDSFIKALGYDINWMISKLRSIFLKRQ